ncbi:MAG: hypothetical protein LBE07_02180 [Gordonia sp. (in: high G+C Gram-positive bacteria)]|jgi:hypothetical protein|nr:hypothetical protein [Gordonia sp. (in: high G+C Gram-positive bacteria)]
MAINKNYALAGAGLVIVMLVGALIGILSSRTSDDSTAAKLPASIANYTTNNVTGIEQFSDLHGKLGECASLADYITFSYYCKNDMADFANTLGNLASEDAELATSDEILEFDRYYTYWLNSNCDTKSGRPTYCNKGTFDLADNSIRLMHKFNVKTTAYTGGAAGN